MNLNQGVAAMLREEMKSASAAMAEALGTVGRLGLLVEMQAAGADAEAGSKPALLAALAEAREEAHRHLCHLQTVQSGAWLDDLTARRMVDALNRLDLVNGEPNWAALAAVLVPIVEARIYAVLPPHAGEAGPLKQQESAT